MNTGNTTIELLLVFLLGAFISTSIHNLISYLARRRKPLRFVFFLWIALIVSIALRFYSLFSGIEPAFQPFGLQVLEMAIICGMVSHLAYNEAARYVKYLIPVGLSAIALNSLFPQFSTLILGVTQLLAYVLLTHLTYQLFQQKKPYFILNLGATVMTTAAFTFFGVGPGGTGNDYPILSRIMILVFYLISFVLHATYLNRMSALTSKKFVESEFLAEKLKELDHLKTKFFSNITHEFRTPLTLIQGPARELYEKEEDPKARQMLNLIRTNSDRLLRLINQLLDLAKLDAREMKLNAAPVDLSDLVKMTATLFSSSAGSKGIEYEVKVAADLPSVIADSEKIETILSNLISNAIKFTSAGGRVSVNATWQRNTFVIGVADTGRGIPPEKLEHIFDRFYQVNPTDSTHSEGTGIGLALVKEYTELMSGIVEVESKVGQGTVFNITLTLEKCVVVPVLPDKQKNTDIDKPLATEEKMDNANGDLPLVLLIEDNAEIRSFIKACLGDYYRYREAEHGKDGLAIACKEMPDIIISDWMMPEMDGVALCSYLKKDKRTDHIPFILLTAKAAFENKIEGLQTGADDYLIKPFSTEELTLKVQNLLALRKRLQAHIKHALLANGTPIEATSVEEKFIVKAKAFVEAHIADERLNVEALAAEMALSREQCYRKITALSGLSPSSFIRKLRLQKAARLLAAKSDTVSQIAYETGFGNLSHFSKAFKEEFGKLPSEYA